MSVAVVFPTVPGREESLERAMASVNGHPVVIRDAATCGEGWVRGAREAVRLGFDRICFAADDVEAHFGFMTAMLEAVDAGQQPAAVVLEPDGSLQSCGGTGWDTCRRGCPDWQQVEWSPTPFVTGGQWEWIEPHAETLADLQYCSDVLISAVLARHGVPSVVRTGAVLTHYNHSAGRGAGMGQHARTERDRAAYEDWLRGLEALCES